MLGALKVLQSLVEGVLEPLDGLDVLYVHGVWGKEQEDRKMQSLRIFKNARSITINICKCRSAAAAAATCNFGERFLLLVDNDAPLTNACTCRVSGEEKKQVLYKYMAEKKKKKRFISFGITDQVPPH